MTEKPEPASVTLHANGAEFHYRVTAEQAEEHFGIKVQDPPRPLYVEYWKPRRARLKAAKDTAK